jgi:hypothetical protein
VAISAIKNVYGLKLIAISHASATTANTKMTATIRASLVAATAASRRASPARLGAS